MATATFKRPMLVRHPEKRDTFVVVSFPVNPAGKTARIFAAGEFNDCLKTLETLSAKKPAALARCKHKPVPNWR